MPLRRSCWHDSISTPVESARGTESQVYWGLWVQTRMTMARTLKLYKLDDEPSTEGLRQMTRADLAQV